MNMPQLPQLPARTDGLSWALHLAQHPDEREAFLAGLTDEQAAMLRYAWSFWARPEQRDPDGPYDVWVDLGGRGKGKTRTGSETVRGWIESGQCSRVALVSDTAADVRDVMIEGPSGILAVCPPWNKPIYESSKRRVTWPDGKVAIAYSCEAPELLRGPEHDGAWFDELAKARNLNRRDQEGGTALTNLMFGLRIGRTPRLIVTTTPRPVMALKKLLKRPGTIVTRGTTFDNKANLSPAFFTSIVAEFGGTRLGRQELGGELLEDTPGALWQSAQIDKLRVPAAPELVRVVIAIDPSGSDNPDADEVGIVAAGWGADGHWYVLHDLSGRYSPAVWGAKAIEHFRILRADRIVAEKNFGGAMVEHVVRSAAQAAGVETIAYRGVTATRGKTVRAEPIAALYEQGRVHHVGTLTALEDELTTWVQGMKSPNRLDALVWALTDLAESAAMSFRLYDGDTDVMTKTDAQIRAEHEQEDAERRAFAAQVVADEIAASGCFFPGECAPIHQGEHQSAIDAARSSLARRMKG